MTLLPTLQARRTEILAIAEKHGIKNVRVFGSVARGEDTPESDVDLLIDVVLPVREGFGFVRFQREVGELLGKHVDIVFETGIYPPMRDTIMQEAKPL